MFWRNLRIGLTVVICLIAGVVFVVWLNDSPVSSGAKPTVVVPANSGQQKQFY